MLWVGVACGHGTKADSAQTPGIGAMSGDRIEKIPGVDVSQLTDTEVQLWISLINEQLSPCGEPRSVARCASERSKCPACEVAATYLSRLVTEGYDKATIEKYYAGRFGEHGKVDFAVDGAHVLGAATARDDRGIQRFPVSLLRRGPSRTHAAGSGIQRSGEAGLQEFPAGPSPSGYGCCASCGGSRSAG